VTRTVVRTRVAAAWLMAAYLAVVAGIVFWPSAHPASASVDAIHGWLMALGAPSGIGPSAVEFVTNVLLFMPLGFLGLLLRPSLGWIGWSLVGLCGSGAIELSQLLVLADRSATLVDVVSNTLGAVLGSRLVVRARPLVDRRRIWKN
jgi:glycopeptide antibiotics resistance protein